MRGATYLVLVSVGYVWVVGLGSCVERWGLQGGGVASSQPYFLAESLLFGCLFFVFRFLFLLEYLWCIEFGVYFFLSTFGALFYLWFSFWCPSWDLIPFILSIYIYNIFFH